MERLTPATSPKPRHRPRSACRKWNKDKLRRRQRWRRSKHDTRKIHNWARARTGYECVISRKKLEETYWTDQCPFMPSSWPRQGPGRRLLWVESDREGEGRRGEGRTGGSKRAGKVWQRGRRGGGGGRAESEWEKRKRKWFKGDYKNDRGKVQQSHRRIKKNDWETYKTDRKKRNEDSSGHVQRAPKRSCKSKSVLQSNHPRVVDDYILAGIIFCSLSIPRVSSLPLLLCFTLTLSGKILVYFPLWREK